MKSFLPALLFFSLSVVSCSQTTTKPVSINEDSIPTSSLVDEGMDSAMIGKLAFDIQKGVYPNIHSLLIARHNKLVYENYWPGNDLTGGANQLVYFTKENLHDLRSVSKSVVSACIGIALQLGKIKSVDQKVLEFFPEYAEQDTGLKSALTIRHLLTMTTGLLWNEDVPYTSFGNTETEMDFSGNPVAFVLARPMQHPSGKVWNYNGGATQLLGSIIEKATGKKLDQFADEYLFQLVGIRKFEWRKYSNTDLPSAPWGLRLRPRDMLKFGLLYSNRGKWNGKQIIPASWVEESSRCHTKVKESAGYGYQFWTWSGQILNRPAQLVAALGNGGQNMIIDQTNHLVLVITAGNYNKSIEKNATSMLGDYIYPALIKK